MDLNKRLEKNVAFVKALKEIDISLLEGREIIFNREIAEHTDSADPQLGWAVLFALGNFQGGDLLVDSLGLRIRLQPGDLIFLRGRVLKHRIDKFTGGQRISIPHFTHTSLWKAAGMEEAVTLNLTK